MLSIRINEMPTPKSKTFGKIKLKRYLALYLLMIPGLVYLIVNNYIPMVGVVIAFKKINFLLGLLKSPWVSFKNFEFLFTTSDAWTITRNTVGYNLIFIVLGTFTSVAVALLLNEIRIKAVRKAYQLIILFPVTISIVIVSYLVYGFLSADNGYINNSVLHRLGLKGISWYSEAKYWPYILTIVNLWKGFGYGSIIYYATIVSIDGTYYEAAVIDGANKVGVFRHVTLPILLPTLSILTLLSISKVFYSDFGLFYQVPNNSGPLIDVTNTIDTYVYRGLIRLSANSLGMSSAANFYQSFVGFALVTSANFLVRRLDSGSSLF